MRIMKKPSLFVRSLVGVGGLGLMLPLTASAATTQQLLNQALKAQMESKRPMVMDGRMTLNGQSNLTKGNIDNGHGSASLRIMSRALAPVAGQKNPDSEGQLLLEKLSVYDPKSTELQDGRLEITTPVGLEWKMVDDALYFRAKDVPMEWTNELPEDLRQYVNQWLKLAIPKELMAAEPTSNGLVAPAMDPKDLLQATLGKELSDAEVLKKKLQTMSVFLVTRTEKKMVVDGKNILRLRVVLNPALITLLQNEELKGAREYPISYRREEVARINKKYTEIRTTLRKFSFAMELNTTDNLVSRMELGAKFTEPVQDCTWNVRTQKDVCKTTGRTTFDLAGGFNFSFRDQQPAVEPPAASVDLMQLFTEYITKSLGTPSSEDLIMPDSEGTTSSQPASM